VWGGKSEPKKRPTRVHLNKEGEHILGGGKKKIEAGQRKRVEEKMLRRE